MDAEEWLECCARKTTEQLLRDTVQMHRVESEMLAPVLAHLAELDKRDAALELGFPSLFAYCVRELGYSEAEAFLRIRAARAARRFPRILGMLARRELHVTAVAKLAPHLTSENYRSLLGRASRRTLEELQTLVAELAPEEERRPVMRTISVEARPAPVPATAPETGDLFAVRGAGLPAPEGGGAPVGGATPAGPGGWGALSGGAEPGLAAAAVPEERSRPEKEARVLFNFVGAESLREKFKRARDLLRHKVPYGEPGLIFEEALDALLDRKDPYRRIARKMKRRQAGGRGQ